MVGIVVAVLGLSLIIERVTDKILHLIPARSREPYAWCISMGLGLLISFLFRFGLMKELGLAASSQIADWLDYLVTGVMLAAGSEPVHSLVGVLAMKKAELQKRVKGV